jgi:hypothetical protein
MEFVFWVYSGEIAKENIKRLIRRGYAVWIKKDQIGYELRAVK